MTGKIRSMIDFAEAEAEGFAPRQSLYERGTMVVQAGVANAKRSRQQWEAMPLVDDYTADFEERIAAEERTDVKVEPHQLRMTRDGRIGVPGSEEPARLITMQGMQGLTTRLGYGGATYLSKCWPNLRAKNFNAWGGHLTTADAEGQARQSADDANDTEKKYETPNLILRTRNGEGASEIYGAVSDSYTSFDVDKVAEAFRLALHGMGARGRVTYDGAKARFEAIFHSDIRPEDYVAGEFFKAGIIVQTDDTGSGSLRGNATVWQNLCLNLMIIDTARQDLFRIRHMGSVAELAKKFRAGIEAGKSKLSHFIHAWGFACKDDVLATARAVAGDVPMKISDALPGLYNGILEHDLVPVRGRREENIKSLIAMYEKDESGAHQDAYVTRAAVVNSFTRFAHEVNDDPWAEDEIQRAASALLHGRNGRAPAALPWIPVESYRSRAVESRSQGHQIKRSDS